MTTATAREHRPRIVGLAGLGVLLALLYSVLGTWSIGRALGGYDVDGGWIGADGEPTAVAPLQVDVTGHPAPWVFAALVAILIATALRARRSARPERCRMIGGIVAAVFVLAVIGVFTFLQLQLIDAALDAGSTRVPLLGNATAEISRMPPA